MKVSRRRLWNQLLVAGLASLGAAIPVAGSWAEAVDYSAVKEWIDSDQPTASGLTPGEVVTQTDIERLRPFVPPGFVGEFDFEGFAAEIQETGRYLPHASYRSATLQHSEQTELAADRSLLHYVSGRPFPAERVEAAPAEDAAYMIAWNQVFRWQYNGMAIEEEHMAFVRNGEAGGRNEPALREAFQGGGHVERYLTNSYQRVYLNHLAHRAEHGHAHELDQADRLHYMDYLAYLHPFEMRGSAMIIERSLDPQREDQVNAYLPAERKVRRLSAKERADSFQGSEFTLDDFEGFNGRVLAYDWIYHGRKSLLYVADTTTGPIVFFGPNSRVPRSRWQLRPCYVVEQRPRVADHPYGRKILFVDTETYNIPLALNFDHDNRLWRVMYGVYEW
ncbi:MAG: DUF1329 domain-containing protein, partial [Myxococcales bacterium]|nr:DUF1329 domain-containing protein [Myxococcales bacterium]